MEHTRKSESEKKNLLVTTQSNLYCAQQEADNLLGKFYKKRQTYDNQTETSGRRKTSIVHNLFSTYAASLQRNIPTTTSTPTRSSPPSYYRRVTISFNTNDKDQNYEKSPPSLKRKTQHESLSVVTNTTADLTQPEAG